LTYEIWTQKKKYSLYITSEHIGAIAHVYSHFLIFKKFKINNKYIIFEIVVKYKIKKNKICKKKI